MPLTLMFSIGLLIDNGPLINVPAPFTEVTPDADWLFPPLCKIILSNCIAPPLPYN